MKKTTVKATTQPKTKNDPISPLRKKKKKKAVTTSSKAKKPKTAPTTLSVINTDNTADMAKIEYLLGKIGPQDESKSNTTTEPSSVLDLSQGIFTSSQQPTREAQVVQLPTKWEVDPSTRVIAWLITAFIAAVGVTAFVTSFLQ